MRRFKMFSLSNLFLCLITLLKESLISNGEQLFEVQETSMQFCPSHSGCWDGFPFITNCCGFCDCQPDCLEYGSCCLTEYLSLSHAQEVVDNKRFGCVKPQYLRKKADTDFNSAIGVEPVWMVTKCQSPVSQVYQEHCEHPDLTHSLDDLVPVYYDNHYRNRFCAYCNGLFTFFEWRVEIQCTDPLLKLPEEKELLSTVKRKKCNIFFKPPLIPNAGVPNTVRCKEQFYRISTCNETGLWPVFNETIDAACRSFQDAFNLTYKNYFCYLCNTDELLPRDDWECKTTDIGASASLQPPFLAILDLSAIKTVGKDTTELVCESEGQFEDKKKVKCFDIMCEKGTFLSDGECRSTNTSTETTCKVVFAKFTPVSDNLFLFSNLVSIEFKNNLQYLLRDLLGSTRDKLEKYDVHMKRTYLEIGAYEVNYLIIRMTFQVPNAQKIDILSELINILHRKTVEVEMNDTSFLFETECVEYGLHLFDDPTTFEFTVPNENGSAFDVIGPIIVHDDILIEFRLLPCISYTAFNKLDVCPFIKLESRDLSYELIRGNLIINETFLFKIMNRWEFRLFAGGILLCLSDYKIIHDAMPEIISNTGTPQILSGPKEIFSLICVCLSVICLVITIVIYATMAELHSQPGINTIILCVTLLLAQITYQFGAGQTDQPSWACAVIGALSHLLWLSVMFSMNVCSVDMFRIFRQLKKVSPSFSLKGTAFRVVYIVLASLTFVLLNYVISASLSDGMDTGYGGALCFLSSTRMHLVTFIIPSMLTIFVNFVLFFYVVMQIGRTRLSVANLHQERNYIGIYTRLSTLTGITWVLGFLQVLVKNDVLEYQFILLNAGQGVFIMVAFVCNKRVISLFRRKSVLRMSSTMSSHISSHTEHTLSS